MKKLLKVSLTAMLVATPMIASAATVPVAYVGGATVGQNGQLSAVTASADVASTSYVKGAYNELAQAINEVNANALTLSTAETGTYTNTDSGLTSTTIGAAITELGTSKQDKIDSSHTLDADLVDDSTSTNKFVTAADKTKWNDAVQNVKVNGTALTEDSSGDVNLTVATGTTAGTIAVNGTDVAVKDVLTTDSTLDGSKLTAGTVAETALAQGVQDKLAAASSALQESDLDDTTIEVDETSNKVQVKAGSIGTTQLDSGVVASLGKADTALQDDSALNGANLTAGTVAETALNSALATKINNAAADKYVTVHTTWGNDSATTSANVLTTTAPASGL